MGSTRSSLPSPFGSARVRAAEAHGTPLPKAALHASVAASLASRGSAQDGAAETVYLAFELVRLATGLNDAEERALLLLAVACIVHMSRGSTYLPIDDDAGVYRGLLDEVGATTDDRQLLARLVQGGAVDPRLAYVVGGTARSAPRTPLVLDRTADARLYVQRMLAYEDRFVAHLARRLAQAPPRAPLARLEDAQAALADVLARPFAGKDGPTHLSAEQQAAVLVAATSPFAAITGGPGTGKTSIIVSLLRTLARLGIPAEAMALAAPTGKAANRMAESIARSLDGIENPAPEDLALRAVANAPETLHRLLGYSPERDRFFHHENNRLSARVVVVDEASMIDLVLSDALVRAVRDDARFVLLGDAEQLPSVDAGAVFRDVIRSNVAGAVRLTHSFRMSANDVDGSAILAAATAVNEGREAVLLDGGPKKRLVAPRASASDVTFHGVELLESRATDADDADGGALGAFLARWFGEHVFTSVGFERRIRKVYSSHDDGFVGEDADDIGWLFEHYRSRRILTVTRGASLRTGAEAVNLRLHHALLAALRVDTDGGGGGRATTTYPVYPGEPVMVTQNDYARGLFNGDHGIVLRVGRAARGAGSLREHHFMAVFPRDGGFTAFPLDALRRELTLAYAMTVHKAQGSEVDILGLVLPDAPMPLLTREIVYTAMTRARRSVVVVGARGIFLGAISKQASRCSGVAEKLTRARTVT